MSQCNSSSCSFVKLIRSLQKVGPSLPETWLLLSELYALLFTLPECTSLLPSAAMLHSSRLGSPSPPPKSVSVWWQPSQRQTAPFRHPDSNSFPTRVQKNFSQLHFWKKQVSHQLPYTHLEMGHCKQFFERCLTVERLNNMIKAWGKIKAKRRQDWDCLPGTNRKSSQSQVSQPWWSQWLWGLPLSWEAVDNWQSKFSSGVRPGSTPMRTQAQEQTLEIFKREHFLIVHFKIH